MWHFSKRLTVSQWVDVLVLKHTIRWIPAWACKRLPLKRDWWALGSAVSKGAVITVNTFSCCLVLGQWPALGVWGLKTSLLLNQPSCVLIKGSDWWFLLVLLLHDKYSLYFYYCTECRHFQTSWGCTCNCPCSSMNPVCWPTIELGVLFSSCYFKINWKTNHSNHFEIKKPHPNQTHNPNQMFVQHMTLKKFIKSQ